MNDKNLRQASNLLAIAAELAAQKPPNEERAREFMRSVLTIITAEYGLTQREREVVTTFCVRAEGRDFAHAQVSGEVEVEVKKSQGAA